MGTELANANEELQAQGAAAAAQGVCIEALQQALLGTGLGFAAVVLDMKVCTADAHLLETHRILLHVSVPSSQFPSRDFVTKASAA